MAVNQGQTQTTEGTNKAYDSLHDLAVTGMGYEIELTLADYSGYAGYNPFPVPNTVDCNDPISKTRYSCFYEKTIVYLVIDGVTVDQYDLTGINGNTGQSKKFNFQFSGDPNKTHNLKIIYNDCWAGYGYTLDSNPTNYIPGITAQIVNAQLHDPTFQFNGTGPWFKSMCNDDHLWDRNLYLLGLKINRADGTQVPVTFDVKWSSPAVNLDFK